MHLNHWSSVNVSTSITAEILVVCCSGAFSCVLMECLGGKTSAMISKKQLLLPVSLGRVMGSFPYCQALGCSEKLQKKHQKPKCYTSDAVSMLGLKSWIWTGYKTYRTMPFGQAVLNWRCVAIMQNTMSGGNQKACQHKYLIPTVEQGGRGWRFRLSAICLTADFWPKWGQAAGQRSQAEEQMCSRMTEKQKNHGVAKA